MSISRFESACLKGVRAAFTEHYKFTGGLSLAEAPESFIQSGIACELAKVARYVSLETTIEMLLREANAELKDQPPRGRIDVVAWWANGKPRFLIEVKKISGYDSITNDSKRLKLVLGRGGATREGLVVVYSDAQKLSTLNKRFKHLADRSHAKESARTKQVAYYSTWRQQERCWQAMCFRVSV